MVEHTLSGGATPSSSSSGSSSGGVREQPRQLRELQMPVLCSVRQLAALLGVQVSQLEAVLKEQLGEEVKSGGKSLQQSNNCCHISQYQKGQLDGGGKQCSCSHCLHSPEQKC